MLVVIKAGSIVDGFRFEHDTPQDHPTEFALQLFKQGDAKPVTFDASGGLEIARNYGAQLCDGRRIDVTECGDRLFSLPPDYPLAHLPAALAAWLHGVTIGETQGRRKLQDEFRRLMKIPD